MPFIVPAQALKEVVESPLSRLQHRGHVLADRIDFMLGCDAAVVLCHLEIIGSAEIDQMASSVAECGGIGACQQNVAIII